MNSNFSGFGFAAGSVLGYRSFRVDPLSRLRAVTHDYTWHPSEHVMRCMREGQPVNPLDNYFTGLMFMSSTSATVNPLPAKGKRAAKAEPAVHKCTGLEDPSCASGIYAYWGDEYNDHADHYTLEGVIEAYGKVIIGSRGFRAEKARLVALVVPPVRKDGLRLKGKKGIAPAQGKRVRELYSPHVPVFDTVAEMVEKFPLSQSEVLPETDENFWTRPA